MKARPRVELLRDLDRSSGWVLLVDGVEQSYVDDVDQAHLEFEYMQHMALVLDVIRPAPDPLDAVHLGGGAMSMPRWCADSRPGSRQVVVEASPEVLEVVARLDPVPHCEVVVADVLDVLPTLPDDSADVVLWDLYDGPRAVTAALSIEAIGEMRRLVRPGGLLLMNVSDAVPFEVVRPVLAALRQCFDDVALLAEPTTLRGRRSGNCVLVGAVGIALPGSTLTRRGAGAPVRAKVLTRDGVDALIDGAEPATAANPLPLPDAALGRAFL